MILNTTAIVLSRRDTGEHDRLAVLYSEDLGKLTVRFGGVRKPAAKLKALSEPFVSGEYRLYLSPRTPYAKALGGRLIDTFPGIRKDLSITVEAMGFCELLDALSVEANPNPEKHRLLGMALEQLQLGAGPWLACAYGLKLLDNAGFKIAEQGLDSQILSYARRFHDLEFAELAVMDWEPDVLRRLRGHVWSEVESHAGRALKTRLFSERLAAVSPPLSATPQLAAR